MSWFFGAFMSDLLTQSFGYKDEDGQTATSRFADNIYVVFSGGDDTFMVGAWDAVFEFAHCLHQNFRAFVADLQTLIINGLPAKEKITLSAALVVIDPKFPVVRFAERAEEALTEAKRWEDAKGERPKNRISVFGQILEWGEFGESRHSGRQLADMIQSKDASRGIIERIKSVAYDYERLAERAAEKQRIPGPKVHRLFYTLRKWTPAAGKEESLKSENEKFIDKTANEFAAGLLTSFSEGKTRSYPKFPVAARWAEFLTRK
jgi:CRISPR-associated protein Csm1